MDRLHLLAALAYAILGIGLGIYMAASHDHGLAVAHAHLLLVGFLLSFLYAVVARLWLQKASRLQQGIQFIVHHLGVVGLVAGLLLLYGGGLGHHVLEPLLASSSILVLISLVLMSVMVVQGGPNTGVERDSGLALD
ncbi:MAG: TonB-dependent receptor [Wenzhouxiangella sp.]|nr:MAG: TonB-dependent receptor [Wenzhouxiangella sp.]